MFLLQSVTVVVTLALAMGQVDYSLPTASRLADQEEQLQVQYNVTYYVAASEKPTISQLFISDEEALELCKDFAIGHASISTYHPRTCAARVLCTRTKKNPFMTNTVYRITAYPFGTAQGTFWDHEDRTQRAQSSSNNCASDPCKTGKAITDGRRCFTYLSCEVSGDSASYKENECDDGQSFDVQTGTCVVDATCTKPVTNRYTNLYCNASTPAVKLPGVKDESYYNRTYRDEEDGQIYSVAEYCTASMVFDQSQPEKCQCIPESKAQCPKTLVDIDSEQSGKNWNNAPEQDGQFSVESSNSQYSGWASFDGSDMSFYAAGALANNELAEDFTLSFRFATSQNPNGAVSLVANSLRADTCPSATLAIYLDAQRNVVAEVTNVNGDVATVQSTAINPTSSTSVELRRDDGQLTLTVNGQQFTSTQSLGTSRLEATNCGLILGKSSERNSLSGWMDKIMLVSRCTNPEK